MASPIIVGAPGVGNISGIQDKNYNYEYPDKLNLKPGSDLSKRICREVYERAQVSYQKMTARHSSWNSIDRVLTAYVPLDEVEKKVKEKDDRKPVSIVVPYAYATLETLLTYFVVSQLKDNDIFKYDGRGPEDVTGAHLMTLLINQQTTRSKTALNLHTMYRDSLAYGLGAGACSWERTITKRTIKQENGFFSFLGNFIGKGFFKDSVETVLYEGNVLKNIDPYCYLPDPSVSVHDIQKGEFVGWLERTNLMNLLSKESTDADVFNVKYLKHLNARTALLREDASQRNTRLGMEGEIRATVKNYVDVIYMYCKIIPKDWGLGESEYPEKWYFAVAGDNVVIEARPIGLNHGLFPLGVAAPDFDGYTSTPVSRLEMVYGLQETLDWLFSSHIANVRKAINDTLIVDPYLINMDDLKDPQPGKLVRLRRAGWGKGVENAVKQLNVQDVTRGHIADSSYIIDLMQRVSSANDSLMGITRKSSERITAAEITGDRTSALNRLERMAIVIGLQAMYDISYLFAAHTQQLMTQDTYVRVVGEWPELLKSIYGDAQRIPVGAYDILVDYDIVLKDMSTNSGMQAWIDLYTILAQNPLVGQQFDTVRIFKYIAQGLGAKDVNAFVRQGGTINPQMMDNEQVIKQADAGNMIPVEQFGAMGA